jgi:RNAse (barnase) inhibitor barstar
LGGVKRSLRLIEIQIDGREFSTLEEFYEALNRQLQPSSEWAYNLDSLNDVLRDGFGDPRKGYRFVWRESSRSRTLLGHPEAARQLRRRLELCHPSNLPVIEAELREAERGLGPTAFDWLVEIIRSHSHIELALE